MRKRAAAKEGGMDAIVHLNWDNWDVYPETTSAKSLRGPQIVFIRFSAGSSYAVCVLEHWTGTSRNAFPGFQYPIGSINLAKAPNQYCTRRRVALVRKYKPSRFRPGVHMLGLQINV
jgi:hypothetical protein